MKKGRIVVAAVILTFLMGSGCKGNSPESISAALGKAYTYVCTDGSTVKARFGALSDQSLNFVKVIAADGKEYTLPQLVSASGARYSDERELEFWIKGNRVTMSKMDEHGEWRVVAEGETREEE